MANTILTRTGLAVTDMPKEATDEPTYCERHGEYRTTGYYCNCCGFWNCADCFDFTGDDKGRCARCRYRDCGPSICNC